MNIWFFVILIIAVALVLGPVSMLKPNPTQKRKEQLRLRAKAAGLRFSWRRLPRLKTDIDQAGNAPVYYLPPSPALLSEPDWMLVRTAYEHEGNFDKTWDWHNAVRPPEPISALLKTFLPEMPESVRAITQGSSGTCVFWLEREDEQALATIIQLLKQLDGLTRPGA